MATDRHTEFLKMFMGVQPVLQRYVFAQIADMHIAEDVLQNIAIVLWQKIDEFDRKRSFRRWAFGIARREVLHAWRADGKRKPVLAEDLDRMLVQRLDCLADELNERRAILSKCLDKLPPRQRQVVSMKYESNRSCRDISRRTDWSENAVRVMLCRIRRALVECVERHLRSEGEGGPAHA